MKLSMVWKLYQELLVPKILTHFSENFALLLEKGQKTAAAWCTWKRKVTEKIKYFSRPFRGDINKSHLKTHSEIGQNINNFLMNKKRIFFDKVPENFVNTLTAYCIFTFLSEESMGNIFSVFLFTHKNLIIVVIGSFYSDHWWLFCHGFHRYKQDLKRDYYWNHIFSTYISTYLGTYTGFKIPVEPKIR